MTYQKASKCVFRPKCSACTLERFFLFWLTHVGMKVLEKYERIPQDENDPAFVEIQKKYEEVLLAAEKYFPLRRGIPSHE